MPPMNMQYANLKEMNHLRNSAKIYGNMTTHAVCKRLNPLHKRTKGSNIKGYVIASIQMAYNATLKK